MKLGPIALLSNALFFSNSYQGPYSDADGPSPLARTSRFEAVAHPDGLEFSFGVSVQYHLLPASPRP